MPLRRLAAATLLLVGGPAWARAEAPVLRLPVACQPGRTCFVQHYVDHAGGQGSRDYTCGNATYPGHDGTDIRVPTTAAMKRGVAVLAAAAGTVVRVRDREPDVANRPDRDASVEGVECGNGVVVDHGGGWQTQYCHMQSGSVRVRPGEPVTAGQALGLVGLSGLSKFPHLHFTVRHDGRVVDPFAAGAPLDTCGGGRALWEPAVAAALAYVPRLVLNGGFTAIVPTMDTVESGEAAASPALPGAPVFAFYVRAVRLQPGDEQELTVLAPDGKVVATTRVPALERGKAQYFAFVGRKRPPQGFPPGTYVGSYRVRNGGRDVLSFEATTRMEPDAGAKGP